MYCPFFGANSYLKNKLVTMPSLTTTDCEQVRSPFVFVTIQQQVPPVKGIADRGIDSNNSHDVISCVSVPPIVPRCNTVQWLYYTYSSPKIKGPMGSTHYFVLRQGAEWIFVTSLHFNTKKHPCLHYHNLQQDSAHQHTCPVHQFSVCIS